VDIVRKRREAPLRQLADNAGVEGAIVVRKSRSARATKATTWPPAKYVDLVKAGIIDPAKVTRSALQNAASIASLLLTTECMITEIPEKDAALTVVAEAGLEIYEIAPRKVKQAIVGYGAAQKLAVAKMVQRLLALSELPAPDAADALALALVHAQENRRYQLTPPKRV
jgi:hypothetical protein